MSSINPPQDFYCPITGELMVDPVVDPEGHSYDRESIMKWLKKKNISPLTRNPLTEKDLKPNIALKNSIESIKDSLNKDQLKISSRIFDEENKKFINKQEDILTNYMVKDNKLLIKINVPDVEVRPPVDVCLTIDVSGSMGEIATLKGDNGETLNYGHTILSVTICAAKTVLNCLNENDNISIVTYTDKSDVIVDYWSVTNENKVMIEKILDELQPLYTTNIWSGLKTSLDLLKAKSPKNRMKGIFLLTDGVPNIEPPRGHENVLENYYKDNPEFNCMINTYGFGYNLKSELLQNLSHISGGDGFAFIPDSSLLGNIFIHGISNFLTTCCLNPQIKITLNDKSKFMDNKSVKIMNINSLKYSQEKHLILDVKNTEDFTCNVELILNDIKITNSEKINDNTIFDEQIVRIKTCEILKICLKEMKFNEKDTVKTIIKTYLMYLNELSQTSYIKNVTYDIEGQVREALNMTNEGEKADWYTRWGRHYLKSLHDAYNNEICNNFKDKGVSNFGGKLFNSLRDTITEIYDKMPAPKQKKVNNILQKNCSQSTLSVIPTMASYNTQFSGGCCAKGSLIKMSDGTEKNVENIKKGDKVKTVSIKNDIITENISEIECLVITKCKNEYEYMVELENNLKITPYHPVYTLSMLKYKWVFPIDISASKPQKIKCETMYTFVVKNRESVIVNDYIFATFGHKLTDNEVIKHDYFGTDKIIDDLEMFKSYKTGYVLLDKCMFLRGRDKKICGIMDIPKTFIETLYFANL